MVSGISSHVCGLEPPCSMVLAQALLWAVRKKRLRTPGKQCSVHLRADFLFI